MHRHLGKLNVVRNLWGRSRGARGDGSDGWLSKKMEEVVVDGVVHPQTREVAFVELSTFRDKELLGGGIVEVPALVIRRIAHKETLAHVGLQLLALVLLHKDVGSASKHPEAAEIWLLAVPGFIGCCCVVLSRNPMA